MPAIETASVASSEPALVEMEDRKRSATSDRSDSPAPPLKKQATSVNGSNKPHPDADMPWKDDLEVIISFLSVPPLFFFFFFFLIVLIICVVQRFQKDAIWRQMQEYKRDKATLEAKLKDMSKASAYHSDHLRVIDAWFHQVSAHSRHISWTFS